MKRETLYQRDLVNRIEQMFPGCVILRNDPSRIQGIPDILILYGPYWAMLEVKRSLNEIVQPNQEYYVENFHAMSYASFICPETEEQVLNDLQFAFGVGREACLSES